MNAAFFTSMQTLATLSIGAALFAIERGEYLVAGVTGFLGILAYLVYELVPTK